MEHLYGNGWFGQNYPAPVLSDLQGNGREETTRNLPGPEQCDPWQRVEVGGVVRTRDLLALLVCLLGCKWIRHQVHKSKRLNQGPALPLAQRNPRSSSPCGLQTNAMDFLISTESTGSWVRVTGAAAQRRGRQGWHLP